MRIRLRSSVCVASTFLNYATSQPLGYFSPQDSLGAGAWLIESQFLQSTHHEENVKEMLFPSDNARAVPLEAVTVSWKATSTVTLRRNRASLGFSKLSLTLIFSFK